MRRIVLSALLIGLFATSRADAQQRPLVTEDPETVGSGLVLIEAGIDLQRDMLLPVSGLTGNLLRLPSFGFSFGASSIVEIQVDGGLYNRFGVTDFDPFAPLASKLDFEGDETTSMEDLVIGTKVRLMSEAPGRPDHQDDHYTGDDAPHDLSPGDDAPYGYSPGDDAPYDYSDAYVAHGSSDGG